MSEDTQQQKRYKILLLGELCQDTYVFGTVSRISPEAPVPILKKQDKECKRGMAGNVYENIKSILENKVDIQFKSNCASKIKKIRFIDRKTSYHLMRYDIEKEFNALELKSIPDDDYNVIVISDYNKGYLNRELIQSLTHKYNNTKIFVDTKKEDLTIFKNCTIKLNHSESINSKNLDNSSKLITTLGPAGCEFDGVSYPAEKVDVYDVCGAGDVFLAALVARWLETKDMIKSIQTANNCASLSVTKLGCYTISRDEYENLRI